MSPVDELEVPETAASTSERLKPPSPSASKALTSCEAASDADPVWLDSNDDKVSLENCDDALVSDAGGGGGGGGGASALSAEDDWPLCRLFPVDVVEEELDRRLRSKVYAWVEGVILLVVICTSYVRRPKG